MTNKIQRALSVSIAVSTAGLAPVAAVPAEASGMREPILLAKLLQPKSRPGTTTASGSTGGTTSTGGSTTTSTSSSTSTATTSPSLSAANVVVDAATDVAESGGSDLAAARALFRGASYPESNGGLDSSASLLGALGTKFSRALNAEYGSYLDGSGRFFASDRLASTLSQIRRQGYGAHVVVGLQQPVFIGTQGYLWLAPHWAAYEDYAYKLVKYVALQADSAGFQESVFEVGNNTDTTQNILELWTLQDRTVPPGDEARYQHYLRVFQVWSRAVDRVARENPGRSIKIAGPAMGGQTMFLSGALWHERFVQDVAAKGQRLDLVTHHFFGDIVNGFKNVPGSSLKGQLERIRGALAAAGRSGTPVAVTEYGPSDASDATFGRINYSHESAAWGAAFIAQALAGGASVGSFAQVRDNFGADATGTPGIASLDYVRNGAEYPKAISNAFRMYTLLPGTRKAVTVSAQQPDVHAFASASGTSAGLIAYNYNYRFNWPADNTDLTVTQAVTPGFSNLAFTGAVTVDRYLVDAGTSNVARFIDANQSPDLSGSTLNIVESCSATVSDGALVLPQRTLGPSAVSLWVVKSGAASGMQACSGASSDTSGGTPSSGTGGSTGTTGPTSTGSTSTGSTSTGSTSTGSTSTGSTSTGSTSTGSTSTGSTSTGSTSTGSTSTGSTSTGSTSTGSTSTGSTSTGSTSTGSTSTGTTTTGGSGTANPQLASLAANSAFSFGPYTRPQLAGCSALPSSITDYSRMTYDSVNHQILMFGGGHAAIPRTDVDVLNLGTGTWSSAYNSTAVSEMTSANLDKATAAWTTTGHPVSRHTYDMLTFAPNTGELIMLQAAGPQPACIETYAWDSYPGKIWHYNPTTKQWTPSTSAPAWSGYGFPGTEYDPVSKKIVLVDANGLYTYDPVTNVSRKERDIGRADMSYAQNLVYYPPTDRMYYMMDNGTVFEVQLDRANLANSTVTQVTGITGTPPAGGETGWAYDSANKIIGGGVNNGVFYAFDPVGKTWTAKTVQASAPVGKVAFHALDYDPVDNVFVFIGTTGTSFTTWAYRYGGTASAGGATTGTSGSSTAGGTTSGGTTSGGTTSGGTTTTPPGSTGTTTTPPAPAEDFATRCSASGVVKCVSFDSAADIPVGYDRNFGVTAGAQTTPQIDTTQKASGGGSLKFTIPSNSGSDSSGTYYTNFSNDLSVQFGENSEFFVQWRQRFSPEFINTFYAGSGGIKQAIITTGDQPSKIYYSCEATEVVVQTYYLNRFPIMYNSCSGSASHGPYDGFYQRFASPNNPYDFKLQNGRPAPYCLYSQDPNFLPPGGNCLGWFPNEWMTFQVRIKTGPRVNNEFSNSYVQMWIAREGQPSELVIDWGPYNLTAGPLAENQRFGKVWLLPYQTNKDPSQAHATAYTWYDDLIISRTRIADPK